MTTHEQLMQMVLDCEDLLEEAWSRHKNPGDILILCDLRREECQQYYAHQYGESAVAQILATSRARRVRPMSAYLQPASLIDSMAQDGDWAHRETAKELRQAASLAALGVVPLLVLVPSGLWATQWSPRGSNALVVRLTPEVGPESN